MQLLLQIRLIRRKYSIFITYYKLLVVSESLNGDFVVDTSVMLGEIHQLVKEVSSSLSFCRDDSVDLPPLLNLDGPMSNESDDPSFIQFKNMMAWDMPNSEPDPGSASLQSEQESALPDPTGQGKLALPR